MNLNDFTVPVDGVDGRILIFFTVEELDFVTFACELKMLMR